MALFNLGKKTDPYASGLFDPNQKIQQSPLTVMPALNPPNVPPPAQPLIPSKGIGGVQFGQGGATNDIDKYRSYLGTQPERKDYQHGKWGKGLSMLAGVAEGYQRGIPEGINVGKGLLDRPYNEAMQDWQTKGGRLRSLAELKLATGEAERKGIETTGKIAADLTSNQIAAANFYRNQRMDEYQIQKIIGDMELAGKEFQIEPTTGRGIWVDKKSQIWQDAGQIGQSPEQKFGDWKQREDYTQDQRIIMKGIDFTNDQLLVSLRGDIDKALAGITTPGEANQASTGAITEIHTLYPGLIEKVFDQITDTNGNVTGVRANPNKDPEAWRIYQRAVAELANRRAQGQEFGPSHVVEAEMDLENTAKQLIRERYKDNPELLTNPEAIKRMKDWLRTNPSMNPNIPNPIGPSGTVPATPPGRGVPNQVPPVNIPPQGSVAPSVGLPPQVPMNPAAPLIGGNTPSPNIPIIPNLQVGPQALVPPTIPSRRFPILPYQRPSDQVFGLVRGLEGMGTR